MNTKPKKVAIAIAELLAIALVWVFITSIIFMLLGDL